MIDISRLPKPNEIKSQHPAKKSQGLISSIVSGAKDVGIGALKGIGSTGVGIGQLLLTKSAEDKYGLTKAKESLKPTNTAQKIGFGAEQIAEFLVPSGIALKGAKALQATKAFKAVPTAVRGLAATTAVEGAVGTGVAAAQQGALNKEALVTGAISAAAVPATRAVFKGAKAAYGGLVAKQAEKVAAKGIPIAGGKIAQKQVTQAVSRGIDKPTVNLITRASAEDKPIFQKMFRLAEQNQGARKVATRPIEVGAGKDITDTASFIVKSRQKAGVALGKEIKKMPNAPVDITSQAQSFIRALQEKAKIKVGKKLNFGGSTITSASDKKLLAEIFRDLRPNKAGVVLRTPQRIDVIRKRLFNELDLGKRNEAFTGLADSIATEARKNLADPLNALSPRYSKLSKQYAQNTDFLTEFTKTLGYKGRLDDLGGQTLRAGEISNRLLSNASARPKELLDRLVKLAREQGYKGTGSIEDKVIFADVLEDLFGSTQTRALRGQVARAGGDVADQALQAGVNLASGNKMGLMQQGINLLRRRTPEHQIEAFRKLLGITK